MTDTVDSNCCNRSIYVFRDNLVGYPLWIYGNISYQNYTAELLVLSQGKKMAVCPASLPFVNFTTNACFICPGNRPIFNLTSRTCVVPCSQDGLIMNYQSHQCEYNTSCQDGYYFSNLTLKCEVSLGSSSRCPLNTPVWDGFNLSCQPCPSYQPFFDITIRACRACTVNEIYDNFTHICYNRLNYHPVFCPNATAYNTATGQCQALNGSVIKARPVTVPQQSLVGSSAACPPYAPFWNPTAFVCAKCPSSKPFFNSSSGLCEVCPAHTLWNSAVGTCQGLISFNNCGTSQYWDPYLLKCTAYPTCTAVQTFNNLTKRCENVPSVGNVGLCPPNVPHWNPVTLTCERCHASTPLFNDTRKACQPCPANTTYDSATNTCNVNVTCASGQVYNLSSHACEKIVCPTVLPVYNAAAGAC
jgi:hypothetical protein